MCILLRQESYEKVRLVRSMRSMRGLNVPRATDGIRPADRNSQNRGFVFVPGNRSRRKRLACGYTDRFQTFLTKGHEGKSALRFANGFRFSEQVIGSRNHPVVSSDPLGSLDACNNGIP